jgi:hypothetical protein
LGERGLTMKSWPCGMSMIFSLEVSLNRALVTLLIKNMTAVQGVLQGAAMMNQGTGCLPGRTFVDSPKFVFGELHIK